MQATLEIVDTATGGWGHVLADHFLLADEPISLSRNARWLDYGPDNYASTSWNGMPDGDDRRVSIGWMANIQYIGSIPTTPWRGQMTFPCELLLVDTPTGLRLAHKPIAEIASLRKRHLTRGEGNVADFNGWLARQDVPKVFECVVEIEVPASESAGLLVGNATEKTSVVWDRTVRELLVDRTRSGAVTFHTQFPKIARAPVFQEGNRLKLHLIGDASSLEVFGGDGTATISSYVFPSPATRGLQFTGSGSVIIRSFDLWELGTVRPVKPDGLIAQWNFNEATPGSYVESTGNGTPMTASPSLIAPAVAPGVAGNAMEVRRQTSPAQVSQLLAPASNAMTADSFTISYHFNPKANDNAKLPQLRWQSPAGLAWGFEILANRQMNFYVFDSKTANDVQSVAQLPFEAFDAAASEADSIDNDPTWHHVAATYHALTGELTLFLDGVKSVKANTGLLGSPRYGTAGNGGGIQTGDSMTIYDDLRIFRGVLPDSSIAFLRAHPGVAMAVTPPPPLPPKTSLNIERHGSSSFIHWPPETGAELWQSENLAENGWSVVPGSRYVNSHASVISHRPKLFFRLVGTDD